MQLIRRLESWPHAEPTVITIGNFDGVHRGHQAMFSATRQAANQHKLAATVVSFEPLPHEYFMGSDAPPRLHGLRDRVRSIADQGIDRLLLLQFDQRLVNLTAVEFIQTVLIDTLKVRHLIVGDDFRFGFQRQGDVALLKQLGQVSGFSVEQSTTCTFDEQRVSSTRVRQSLQEGNLALANALLGRSYSLSGRVVHGAKLGRQLGFPTANVRLGTHRPPLRGVFAVQVRQTIGDQCFSAVANLGERPTVNGRSLLLEVHALDASPNWYGQHLTVDFIARIRSEQRFDSLSALKDQIGRDVSEASRLLQ